MEIVVSCSEELDEVLDDEELDEADEDELTDEELLVALDVTELEVALESSLELSLKSDDSDELLVVPQATIKVRNSGNNNNFFFMRIPPTEYELILSKLSRLDHLKDDNFFKRKNRAMILGFIHLFLSVKNC